MLINDIKLKSRLLFTLYNHKTKRKNRLARSVLSFKTIRRGFSSSRGVGFESINYFTIFIIT